jgi:hypothetical protein
MRYYLSELREKLAKYPESLCLRNGIARIEEILELPKTIESVDPIATIDRLMADEIAAREGRCG